MSTTHRLTVGQRLYYVPSRGASRWVTVTKVGRKWATCDDDSRMEFRVNLDTLVIDGGGYDSPGKCYLDEDVYRASVRRVEAWKAFYTLISRTYTAPSHLTAEAIEAMQATVEGR